MTVQELIDALLALPDKNLPVVHRNSCMSYGVDLLPPKLEVDKDAGHVVIDGE